MIFLNNINRRRSSSEEEGLVNIYVAFRPRTLFKYFKTNRLWIRVAADVCKIIENNKKSNRVIQKFQEIIMVLE